MAEKAVRGDLRLVFGARAPGDGLLRPAPGLADRFEVDLRGDLAQQQRCGGRSQRLPVPPRPRLHQVVDRADRVSPGCRGFGPRPGTRPRPPTAGPARSARGPACGRARNGSRVNRGPVASGLLRTKRARSRSGTSMAVGGACTLYDAIRSSEANRFRAIAFIPIRRRSTVRGDMGWCCLNTLRSEAP